MALGQEGPHPAPQETDFASACCLLPGAWLGAHPGPVSPVLRTPSDLKKSLQGTSQFSQSHQCPTRAWEGISLLPSVFKARRQ